MKNLLTINKNVYLIILGNAIAQLIPFLMVPALSRIYTPSDYALLGLMLAGSNVLFELYTLRYDRIIVISTNKVVSMNILFACLIISLIFTIFFSVIFYYSDALTYFYTIHKNFGILRFILPVITFFMSGTYSINYWFQRGSHYNKIIFGKIIQMTSISLLCLMLGKLRINNGLIWGYLIGWLIVFIVSVYWILKTDVDIKKFRLSIIIETIRKYREYPIYNTLPSIIYVIASSAPYYMVSYLYGKENGGFFNMCKQILLVPLSFIGIAFSQVYFKKISDVISNKTRIFPKLKGVLIFLFMIAIVIILFLGILGDMFFKWFLGNKWDGFSAITFLYSFSAVSQMFYMALSFIYPSLNKIKTESFFKLLYSLCIFILLFFSPNNIQEFMLIYSITEFILFFLNIIYMLFLINRYDSFALNGKTFK